jgi:tetratricopeptide (TPR) repeat protein
VRRQAAPWLRGAIWAAAALWACLAGGGALAGPLEDRFDAAGRAYESGEFGDSAREYQALIDQGVRAPEVFYNLGNAAFRLGRLAEAILNYERALRLDPGDEDARHNLEFCRQRIADREEDRGHWVVSAYQGWTRAAGLDGEAWLLLGLYLPGMVSLGIWIVARREVLRRSARFAALCLLGLALPAAAMVGLRATLAAGPPAAIIMVEKAEGRSGPGEDHAILFTVHEGLRVQVRNQSGAWAHVLLPNGINGWLPAASLQEI